MHAKTDIEPGCQIRMPSTEQVVKLLVKSILGAPLCCLFLPSCLWMHSFTKSFKCFPTSGYV